MTVARYGVKAGYPQRLKAARPKMQSGIKQMQASYDTPILVDETLCT